LRNWKHQQGLLHETFSLHNQLTHPTSHNFESKKMIYNQPERPSMKRYTIIFSLCCASLVHAMETQPTLQPQTLADIPTYCITLATTLLAQPSFMDCSASVKVLPLKNWNDCRTLELLSATHKKFLGCRLAWVIGATSMGYPSHPLWSATGGHGGGQGIFFQSYNDDDTCALDELQTSYIRAIDSLKSNWVATSLQTYPDIFHKESESEWFLFIKEKQIEDEDTLIRFLASKFDMRNQISCHDMWKISEELTHCKEIYLWVKKDAFDTFQQIFDFKIQN
jgi:hypothetical protein